MLELSLNNNIIPLPRDFRMRVTIKSPFFQFDKIPFSYSLDFSLPINEYTSAIFAHPERITKRRWGTENKYSGFKVTFKGSLFLSGSVTLTVQGKSYSLTAVDAVGVLNDATQEKSITDLLKLNEELDFINVANYDPDVHPYCCFPVINNLFFKDKSKKVTRPVMVNEPGVGLVESEDEYETEALSYCFSKTTESTVNAKNGDGTIKELASTINVSGAASYETGQVTVVTPFFFLNSIIKLALKENNIHIIENYINDHPVLKNLCIYNNYDITEMAYDTGLVNLTRLFSNFMSFDGSTPIEDYSSSGAEVVSYVRSYLNKLTAKNHVPKMKVGEMLLSTQNEFNLMFDFLPNSTVNVFSREELMSMEAINIDKYLIGKLEPGKMENTAIKFIRQTDDQDLVFSERFVNLDDRRGDIKEPVADWDALLALTFPQQGDIRYIAASNKFAEYKWATSSETDKFTQKDYTKDLLGWEEISISLQNGWYQYGRTTVKEIETTWGTCFSVAGKILVNQPGQQKSWKASERSFTPRLLIYLGNNTGGNEHPDLSFEYEKAGNGLLAKCWKKTSRMLANALPMTVYANFPVNVLHSIIFNKCLPYRNDEASFFIDEFNFDLMIDRVGTVEMKVYKRD